MSMIEENNNAKVNEKAKLKRIKTKKARFVDEPNKPEIPSQYLYRVEQLYQTKKKFTLKDFQEVRTVSNRKEIIDSFQRIGMVLNDVLPSSLPKKEITKVCFIVVNSSISSFDYCGIGSFNDAFMIGKFHQKLNYKVFLLYNSTAEVFLQFLEFFLTYTKKYLTFYYSGRDAISVGTHGLCFVDKSKVFHDDLAKFICDKCNEKSRILIISDCVQGGAIFDMNVVKYRKKTQPKKLSNIIVFYVIKKDVKKELKGLTHGLFTFLFCRTVKKNPHITSWQLIDALNLECLRFKESFNIDISVRDLDNTILFKRAYLVYKVKEEKVDKVDEVGTEIGLTDIF